MPTICIHCISNTNSTNIICWFLDSLKHNWINHQGVENFFSLKTLSLCEGNLLKDLTGDSHNRNMSNTKTWLGFPLYT